jgi:hypothetical protein
MKIHFQRNKVKNQYIYNKKTKMKKLNTTYLDSLVSKVLKETLEEKADSLVSKINGDVCECGGKMYEGECTECGYTKGNMEEDIHDVEDINNDNDFDYVGESDESGYNEDDARITCEKHIEMFGEDDEVTQKLCQGVNLSESSKGRRRRQGKKSETDEGNAFTGALSQARKSGKKDFEVDGKKFETKEGKKSETGEGNAFTGALSKARKSGEKDFEVDGKKFETKEAKKMDKKGTDNSLKRYCGGEITKPCIDRASKSGSPSLVKKANSVEPKKKIKESYRLTESEMISMIEKIVLEQKSKEVKDPAEKNNIKGMGGSPRGLEVYKKAHNGSGKENDDYIKSVAKKMKEYLKDGSKGEYEMNPKTFPVGNGELEKMDKKAFEMTDDLEDFNYEIAGLNLPTPDAIEFNEDWMEKLYKGDSTTGNAPGGNALESKTNDRFNKLRKKNTLKKLKDQSYNRVPQPVFNEKTGTEKGKGVNIKLESIEDKKAKQINEEFNRMKSLIGYNQRTQ